MIAVGVPQVVSGELLARSREIVSRFNRFYSDVARAYYERPELRADHLINSLLEPLLEIDGDNPITTPLSRLDAVLEDDGSIRVIEINSVGVPRAHARPVLLDPRAIARRVRRGRGDARSARARHGRPRFPRVRARSDRSPRGRCSAR